jgi:hypothetical protein
VWNLLDQGTEVCFFSNIQNISKEFFSNKTIWYFVVKFGLRSNWKRLFIDSSEVGFKAILLHNGRKFPSVPLGQGAWGSVVVKALR